MPEIGGGLAQIWGAHEPQDSGLNAGPGAWVPLLVLWLSLQVPPDLDTGPSHCPLRGL